MLDINSLIIDKLNGKNHSYQQINFIVESYLKNNISDNLMTKWLKAILKHDMNIDETIYYTESIINSGKKIKFDNLDGYIIDKHSTGGVGDKVSLILGPILAACGCYVPMIVGRFLGHTGGTLDKLESISGYNGLLTSKRFSEVVRNVGISIIGQTNEICPADRKIYDLRGKTNTVSSFPLICGSIMSKKIAEGIQGLVLDIKVGNGAFIENEIKAEKLGKLLSLIGGKFDVDVRFVNSDMNQPLGYYSGLLCEISESVDALKGRGSKDLMNIVFKLGELALSMANIENPANKINEVINNGSALEILFKMIYEHGGDLDKLNFNYKYSIDICSKQEGYIKYIDTKSIGESVNFLTILNGSVDINSGIKFLFKNKDYVKEGSIICQIFGNNISNIEIVKNSIKKSISINQDSTFEN